MEEIFKTVIKTNENLFTFECDHNNGNIFNKKKLIKFV